jgi:hypothetical protein
MLLPKIVGLGGIGLTMILILADVSEIQPFFSKTSEYEPSSLELIRVNNKSGPVRAKLPLGVIHL